MSPKSLSRILLVKERLRQWKRAELAAASVLVERAEEHVAAQDELSKRVTAAVTQPSELSGEELAMRAQTMARAHRDLKKARASLEERHQERETQRDEVAVASRDVRVLETLRQRMQSEEDRVERTREQGELDDISAHRGKKS